MTDLSYSPPHSMEAEQGVLGGLMLDNEAWDLVGDLLQADDFFRGEHRLIFTAIQELSEKNSPFDVVTIFEQMAVPEEVGGLSYLAELAKNTPSVANIQSYAEIVRNRAHLRRIMSRVSRGHGMQLNLLLTRRRFRTRSSRSCSRWAKVALYVNSPT
mgnify:CR=1 FL=1